MQYMLDTDIVSDLMKDPNGKVARRVDELGDETALAISIITAAELRFGLAKRPSRRLQRRLGTVLAIIDILPFEEPADAVYARLRTDLERRGQIIGGNDLLIAAHAVAAGHVLVSGNEREFGRVEGLALENWLA
jgi:tRNA(fMet)-specific endonuclease VapC